MPRKQDDDPQDLRQRAEQRLKASQKTATGPPDASEALALLHELQVHQIELELQNEALQQARDEAEAARDLFARFYEHAPIAYFNLDPSGRVIRANRMGAMLLEVQRGRLMKRPLDSWIDQADRPRLARLLWRVFAGETPPPLEVAITTDQGNPRSLRLETGIWPDAKSCMLMAVDITDMVMARQALQVAASVYEVLDEAVMIADADERILSVNPAFTRLTGYTCEEILGQPMDRIRDQREPGDFDDHLYRTLHVSGSWQGEIWHRHHSGKPYMAWMSMHLFRDEQGRPQRYIGVFRDITEQRRMEQSIWYQANYDPLTALPNRQLFQDRLRQGIRHARRHGHILALLFIDLDRFKEVNDRLGHEAGDRVLKEAGRRISQCVRQSDTCARLSGDEFTVLMEDLTATVGVDEVAEKILKALDRPFDVDHHRVTLQASIGVAFCPADASDPGGLIKCADQAMYAAKQAGGQRLEQCSRRVDASLAVRSALLADLPRALQRDEFTLVFQPILELKSHQVVMYEALVRWDHPQRGQLYPEHFLGLAEGAGLLERIDAWVFQHALEALSEMNIQRGHRDTLLKMAVNEHFPNDATAGSMEDRPHPGSGPGQARVSPDCMVIEVTERLLQDGGQKIAARMDSAHAHGFKLALSQFGIGRRGIPYLQRYPFDLLKLDRSFVQHLPWDAVDQTAVQSIIDMAHGLGLRVVAEGVETEQQHEWLMAAECDYAQGYLYDRPLTLPDVLSRFEDGSAQQTPSADGG
ncbi:putative bifunctional diguanylate cyclase/phosphodiesterase [Ectothiorhodospira mobilis]|uniref:putative bifunctional diguanylate cyclase/phosphodiesterase n=1 Tax=Ectothiorhodospira mobilis TaxID=195064 RepID=UPI001EE798DE|nr:EAL domain-containing protein [Ectothiorhodospira mobilis]MCG5535446.1 EAL domain-containing protein [Ectothiorhodospira mobilis]